MTTVNPGNAPVQPGINANNTQNASNVTVKQKGRLTTGQKVAIVALAIFVAAALFPLAAIALPLIILAPVVGVLVGLAVAASFKQRNIELYDHADSYRQRNIEMYDYEDPTLRLRWYHSPVFFWNWTVIRPRRWHFLRRRSRPSMNHLHRTIHHNHAGKVAPGTRRTHATPVPRVVQHNTAGKQVPGTGRTASRASQTNTHARKAPKAARENHAAASMRSNAGQSGRLPTRGVSSSGSRTSVKQASLLGSLFSSRAPKPSSGQSSRPSGGRLPRQGVSSSGQRASFGRTSSFGGGRRG